MATATATAKVTGHVTVRISLDWSGAGHYDGRWQRACRFCGELTNLRDDAGEAAHKTCVEGDIEVKTVAYAQSLLPVARRAVKAA